MKGMKLHAGSGRREKLTMITFASFLIYLAFPARFLYFKISKALPIFTTYLWLMSIWFYVLVRR